MAVATHEQAFFVSGGTMPEKARSYVERAADKRLHECLMTGMYSYVLNSRQMGKSSLCVRARMRLEDQGVRTAFIDLTRIGGRNVSAEQWYAGLLAEISRSLNLRTELLRYWKENDHLSPLQRLFTSLGDVVLATIKEPLVIFVDEIDATRSLQFDTDEFFAGVRECFSRRVQDERYNRLTFCLLGVAVPSDLIRSSQSTPFNIGERIYLRDFTLEETQGFGAGLPFRERLIDRVHYWTGGHPFLTQSLCSSIGRDDSIQTTSDVDHLVEREFLDSAARESNMNLSDVGSRVVNGCPPGEDVEKFRANILSSYKWSLKNRKAIPDDESNRLSSVLKLSGLMRSEDGFLTVRNRIYRRAFNATWIKENMPGQELHRQKRAMWLGVSRTAAIALIGLILIGTLAYRNNQFRQLALKERDRANSELYSADMILMSDLWQKGDIKRMRTMLSDVRATRMKGWEWQLWHRLASRDERVVSTQGVSGKSLSKDDASEDTIPRIRLPHTEYVKAQIGTDGKVIALSQSGGLDVIDSLGTRHPESLALKNCIGLGSYHPWVFRKVADRGIEITNAITSETVGTLPIRETPTLLVEFQNASKVFVVHGKDGQVWDTKTGHGEQTYSFDQNITAAAVSSDDGILAIGQASGVISIFDLHGRFRKTHGVHTSEVLSIRFIDGDKNLLSTSTDGNATVTELVTAKPSQTLVGHSQPVNAVTLSPDGLRFVTGGDDRIVRVWDVETGHELTLLKGYEGPIAAVQFSQDGKTLITVDRTGVVLLWPTEDSWRSEHPDNK